MEGARALETHSIPHDANELQMQTTRNKVNESYCKQVTLLAHKIFSSTNVKLQT
jgi:hypothetical protein